MSRGQRAPALFRHHSSHSLRALDRLHFLHLHLINGNTQCMKKHTFCVVMDDNPSECQEQCAPDQFATDQFAQNNDNNGHKRSTSGGLSKLATLRASAENNQMQADTPPSPEQRFGEVPVSPKKINRAMAVAVQQQKTRRRKGSLRKAALLGRGVQRQTSQLDTSRLVTSAFGVDGVVSPTLPDGTPHQELPHSDSPARPERPRYPILDSYQNSRPTESIGFSLPSSVLAPKPQSPAVANALKPSPPLSYTSTTSDDEPPTFHRISNTASISASSDTSYFGHSLPSSLFHRRSSPFKTPSPVSHALSLSSSPSDSWDYSTTAFWGYVILITTWLVFVVGMGSCFGVWSWAWNVGETPYAPPELEDDPTLPITGYYPALIILTAVMAWVWVVVAWVGMKYFRHARIEGA